VTFWFCASTRLASQEPRSTPVRHPIVSNTFRLDQQEFGAQQHQRLKYLERNNIFTMTEHTTADPFIPYGRGGAGNMRRQSSIRDAWFKITSQADSSQDTAKLEPARTSTSTARRRASSTWSSSTAGERRFGWKRLFRRRSSEEERDEDDKIEESE